MGDTKYAGLQIRLCKYCGRKMAFATDQDGKIQALDLVSPVYEVTEEDEADPTADVCRRTHRAFVSHFVTCPEREKAKENRRKK